MLVRFGIIALAPALAGVASLAGCGGTVVVDNGTTGSGAGGGSGTGTSAGPSGSGAGTAVGSAAVGSAGTTSGTAVGMGGGDPCGPVTCKPGASCVGGVCTCGGGLTECPAACVDLSSDIENCGSCGQACAVDEVCVARACLPFVDARGCAACPCDACTGDFARCCTYPGGARICVDGDACP